MLLYLLLSSFLSLIFSFTLLTNPMSMTISILMMALLGSLTLSLFSSWMAILMFLVYVSGMLIMFIYFSAISMNKKLEFMNILPMFFTLLFMLFYLFSFLSLSLNTFFSSLLFFSSLTFFLKSNIFMLFIFILFLLFSLIIVTKISFISKTPLRPFT
uniref:NADH dehydrogenase subunit 6 n=1 Tax=Oligobrachia dogieli TaxID=3095170 RepID=UPI002E7735DC|nr:NADH dehydrogenase subunit 6 [Oligobrachia dogieli]WPV72841.1 NADH dehydrogenase subunit 6 [Oligobrachia dogieli]